MGGYTKLFESLLDSTVWQEPGPTRLTWITMIAMADQNGIVAASIPGLAKRAGVTLDECLAALETFKAPDPYSRTPAHEGRRIEPVLGGWVLLNHAYYRGLREAEDRREQAKLGMQALRARRKGVNEGVNGLENVNYVGQAEAEAATEQEPKALRDKSRGFDDFWQLYPLKKGKAAALKTWKSRDLGKHLDTILTDVRARMAGDKDWARGAIPYGSTYVQQERWQDALNGDALPSQQPAAHKPPSKETPEERARKTAEANAALARLQAEVGFKS